jgi:hypothetical protein
MEGTGSARESERERCVQMDRMVHTYVFQERAKGPAVPLPSLTNALHIYLIGPFSFYDPF